METGPSLRNLEPPTFLTLNRAELDAVSETPGSGSKNIELLKTLTLRYPPPSCHPRGSSSPDSVQSGWIQSSQDGICPMRTTLPMARQSMGSWGGGSKIGEKSQEGTEKWERDTPPVTVCPSRPLSCTDSSGWQRNMGWMVRPTPST